MRVARSLGVWLARLLALALTVWVAAALWFDGPASRGAAGALAVAAALASLVLIFLVRPARRGLGLFALLFAGVLVWWLAIPPSAERDWQDDVARVPVPRLDGDTLVLENVRHFVWRADDDYDVAWETREYDLADVTGLDLFLCQWGPRAIAHTILSWQFADGRTLAISIETRKEKGEEYSAVLGFFRQFELYFVVADERDVIGVRATCRDEDVYLYRLRTPPERARALLRDYMQEVASLAAQPRWYNAFDANCTTEIFSRLAHIMDGVPFDWRILVNGYIDEMLWEEGVINTSMSPAELRVVSRVSERARAAGQSPDFSERLRDGLPSRPPPPPF